MILLANVLTLRSFKGLSCASASVLRINQKCFVGVPVGQCLKHCVLSQNRNHCTLRCAWGCGAWCAWTFQPLRCGSSLAACEAAVDVLSDAHVHPSGRKRRVSHVILMIVPFVHQRHVLLRVKVHVTSVLLRRSISTRWMSIREMQTLKQAQTQSHKRCHIRGQKPAICKKNRSDGRCLTHSES